ncbi:hypothetical protein SAMN06272737_1467 [Blastococcus mobilis]|uniref:Uncharacterized protein n=1 Tax=Blastococcus mobilis TaxID=1938746 RepID=A0A239AK38_9ACTN|nr:hypothetical protein SAMN06272737_1467 [Blastococcus mobilis]
MVDPAGALELLNRLRVAGPTETEAIYDCTVCMPDGSFLALGDATGSQVAELRQWVRGTPTPAGDSR